MVAWAAAMEAAATAATVAAATEVALAAHGGGGAGGGDRGGGEDVDLHEQDTQRRVSRLEVICCESDGAHAVQCQTGKELDMRVRWEAEPCVCMAVVGTAARAHCRPTAFATAVRRSACGGSDLSAAAHAAHGWERGSTCMRVRWEYEPCVCMAVVGTGARAHCCTEGVWHRP